MTAAHELRESDHGTVNTLSVDLAGVLAPVLGRLLRRAITKALATENAGFKQAAERQLQ